MKIKRKSRARVKVDQQILNLIFKIWRYKDQIQVALKRVKVLLWRLRHWTHQQYNNCLKKLQSYKICRETMKKLSHNSKGIKVAQELKHSKLSNKTSNSTVAETLLLDYQITIQIMVKAILNLSLRLMLEMLIIHRRLIHLLECKPLSNRLLL